MSDFDSNFYLKRRFSDPEDKERGAHPFLLKSIHDFYKAFGPQFGSKNPKMLEFGGGPVVYSLISAAPFVSEITFADYSATNLKAVELWRDCKPLAHDWEPYVSYVISRLEEGSQDNLEELARQRMREMRSKIVHISHCDIFRANIVDPPTPKTFDVISTHFCLDPASKSNT